MGRLERKLDLDLIEQIEASGRPQKRRPMLKRSEPRTANTYRGYRRNNRTHEQKASKTYV